jgi:hypothetical protein
MGEVQCTDLPDQKPETPKAAELLGSQIDPAESDATHGRRQGPGLGCVLAVEVSEVRAASFIE